MNEQNWGFVLTLTRTWHVFRAEMTDFSAFCSAIRRISNLSSGQQLSELRVDHSDSKACSENCIGFRDLSTRQTWTDRRLPERIRPISLSVIGFDIWWSCAPLNLSHSLFSSDFCSFSPRCSLCFWSRPAFFLKFTQRTFLKIFLTEIFRITIRKSYFFHQIFINFPQFEIITNHFSMTFIEFYSKTRALQEKALNFDENFSFFWKLRNNLMDNKLNSILMTIHQFIKVYWI